jgi:5-methylcytosine-specific restriction endonuclease McrA
MPKSNFKRRRIVLDPDAYRELCRAVFERDGWTCLLCPSRARLQAHHVKYRSHGGNDAIDNLATLCWICHDQVHRKKDLRNKLENLFKVKTGARDEKQTEGSE